MSYYQHIDDFDGVVPLDNAMPSDVKRLISHCNHNYHKRYYFFSPSQRAFYRYYRDATSAYQLATKQHQKYPVVQLIPDEDERCKASRDFVVGTAKTPNIRDSICISNRFIQRIENMNKLILPNQRTQ